MTQGASGPFWLASFRALCRVILRLYPGGFQNACGLELLETSVERVRETRATRGRIAAVRFALAEIGSVVFAAAEIRRSVFRPAGRAGRLEAIVDDVGQSIRGIRRTPASAGVVVLLVGLAVGLTTSVYSVIEGLLLEPLPFTQSDELVHVWAERPWQDESRGLLADVQLRSLRENNQSFAGLSALWMVSGRVLGGERPVHTDVGRVSSNFFDILGVEAYLGRTFEPGEDQPGAPWVAVLDYDYWIGAFNADPHVIGKRVVVGWYEMEIIGVLPRDFFFRAPPELGAQRSPEVWIPWRHSYRENGRTVGGVLAVVGRIRDGVVLAEARRDLKRMAETEDRMYYDHKGFEYRIEPLQAAWTADTRSALMILAGAGVFMLLIATANATTLLLARNQSRRRELGVRYALGASEFRIARLLVIESLVLSLAGGMFGVTLAEWGTRGLLELAPAGLSRLDAIGVDGSVLGVALLMSVAMGLAAAVASLVRLRRAGLDESLRGSRGRIAASTRTRRVQRLFVIVEVACSAVLLFQAGLLIRTFDHIQSTDLGFQAEGRLTFSTYLMNDYATHDSQIAFYRELRAHISRIPGVRSVSGTSALPLSGSAPRLPASRFMRRHDVKADGFFLPEGFSVLFADELDGLSGDGWMFTDVTTAQPDYFRATGIPLLAGREFDQRDGTGEPPRAIIDLTLADRLWTAQTAVGQRLWIAGAWREVVGVAHPTVMTEVRAAPSAQVYLPYDQVRSGRVSMVVHTTGDPTRLIPAIRQAVSALDPQVPIADIRTLESIVDDVTAGDRFSTLLMTVFAAVAMLMVAVGVYGVLAFSVRERVWEMSLRLTVGMGRGRLAGMVLREGVMPAMLGLVIGIGVAFVVARSTQAVLYGIGPHDPLTIAGVSVVIVALSVLASWIPAVRALSVNPADALQTD